MRTSFSDWKKLLAFADKKAESDSEKLVSSGFSPNIVRKDVRFFHEFSEYVTMNPPIESSKINQRTIEVLFTKYMDELIYQMDVVLAKRKTSLPKLSRN